MKSILRIVFAASFCFVISQANVRGNNGATGSITPNVELPQAGKVSSTVPAKPIVSDVKNDVSTIRAFTGLTKAAFEAKMKSLGFDAAQDEIGMGGQAYKSKSAGYMLAVKYGTRGKDEFVRDIYKGTLSPNPDFTTLKTTFLDLGKQCINLKAKYSGGFVKSLGEKVNAENIRTLQDRNSKFLPAFDQMISTNEDGGAVDGYTEKDYDYIFTYRYTKAFTSAVIIIHITDKTLVSK